MGADPRVLKVEAALRQARERLAVSSAEGSDDAALYLPHLQRSLKIVQRYAAVESDAPFVSQLPLIAPLVVRGKTFARRVLRGSLRGAFGSQAEFNAAVAEILFEFTRRAAVAQNPPPTPANRVNSFEATCQPDSRDPVLGAVLRDLMQEIAALRESTRAANLSAAEAERAVAELRRELEQLKHSAE